MVQVAAYRFVFHYKLTQLNSEVKLAFVVQLRLFFTYQFLKPNQSMPKAKDAVILAHCLGIIKSDSNSCLQKNFIGLARRGL